MSNAKKRTYNSTSRAAKAAENRARILNSAKELFRSEGFEGVTIDKIARAANVSPPTIYAVFKSKLGILRELLDEAMPPEQHKRLVDQGKQEPSPKARLAIAAKITRQLYDAEKSQADFLRGAVLLSPEFKALEKEREARRYKRQEEAMQTLYNESALAKGLTLTKVRDILWAFTGRDMYRLFVIERGWSSDEYETWLTALLVKTLLRSH